ncbi:MAG: phosphoglycerate mutase family protein [Patescibacteria group bacterium]
MQQKQLNKIIYLLRHAEKDPNGTLTDKGRNEAKELRLKLPQFEKVICSDSARSEETASLITGTKPQVDKRCGFYMAPKEKSDLLNKIATDRKIPFLNAVAILNDAEVNEGINKKSDELISLIQETLQKLQQNGAALIVSHDLSISPAMEKFGIPLESIDYLSGYIIDGENKVKKFNRTK